MVPGHGSGPPGESRTKMSSLVAESEPRVSQEKHEVWHHFCRRGGPFIPSHTHTHTHTHTDQYTEYMAQVSHPIPEDAWSWAKGSREQRAGPPGTQNLVYLHAVQFNKGRLSIPGTAGTHTHQLTPWPKTHRHVRDVELHGCLGTSRRDIL